MNPGTGWTAQHVELAIALTVCWEECARAKQDSTMEWESAGTALGRRLTAVMLMAALCESLANLYFALKLENAEFQRIERRTPYAKPKMTDDRGIKHPGTSDLWKKIDERASARIWNLPRRFLEDMVNFEHLPAAMITGSLIGYLTDFRLTKDSVNKPALHSIRLFKFQRHALFVRHSLCLQ